MRPRRPGVAGWRRSPVGCWPNCAHSALQPKSRAMTSLRDGECSREPTPSLNLPLSSSLAPLHPWVPRPSESSAFLLPREPETVKYRLPPAPCQPRHSYTLPYPPYSATLQALLFFVALPPTHPYTLAEAKLTSSCCQRRSGTLLLALPMPPLKCSPADLMKLLPRTLRGHVRVQLRRAAATPHARARIRHGDDVH